MRILFIGDVFGAPGRDALARWLPRFREEEGIEFVVVNAENSAKGKGITRRTVEELFRAGADALTGGNHTFAQRDALELVRDDARILRPANLPPGTPGHGSCVYSTTGGARVGVLNLMGRAFMKAIDCPFRAAESACEDLLRETPVLVVDFHAEATSEKVGMAVFLDGKATVVVGTHTHVPTADARVTAAGTAAVTDVGMTGAYDGIIGVRSDIVLAQMVVGMPARHEVATGDVRICGLLVDADPDTGRASECRAIRHPEFQTRLGSGGS